MENKSLRQITKTLEELLAQPTVTKTQGGVVITTRQQQIRIMRGSSSKRQSSLTKYR